MPLVLPAMRVLETPRLVLRHLDSGDAAFILELLNEPAWLRHIGDRGVRNLEDARRYIQDGPAAMIARHGFGLFAVALKEGGGLIGICGLLKRDSLPDVDLGFAFLSRFTGQGYAREATSATLDHAQRNLGLRRVVAITSKENQGSIRVLEGIGLVFETTLRLHGEDRDVELYAWEA